MNIKFPFNENISSWLWSILDHRSMTKAEEDPLVTKTYWFECLNTKRLSCDKTSFSFHFANQRWHKVKLVRLCRNFFSQISDFIVKNNDEKGARHSELMTRKAISTRSKSNRLMGLEGIEMLNGIYSNFCRQKKFHKYLWKNRRAKPFFLSFFSFFVRFTRFSSEKKDWITLIIPTLIWRGAPTFFNWNVHQIGLNWKYFNEKL